eukprot:TRINITY_DN15060_c0_g1_i2.p1 TRINITY_DN15060_c0_g1~~TRINITY_DN15060_c0_g1_i2.p1  ORF type:complete len:203 (+),score=31.03 TRINITY_DN15060_c0_g1_i2:103-711(+)
MRTPRWLPAATALVSGLLAGSLDSANGALTAGDGAADSDRVITAGHIATDEGISGGIALQNFIGSDSVNGRSVNTAFGGPHLRLSGANCGDGAVAGRIGVVGDEGVARGASDVGGGADYTVVTPYVAGRATTVLAQEHAEGLRLKSGTYNVDAGVAATSLRSRAKAAASGTQGRPDLPTIAIFMVLGLWCVCFAICCCCCVH